MDGAKKMELFSIFSIVYVAMCINMKFNTISGFAELWIVHQPLYKFTENSDLIIEK